MVPASEGESKTQAPDATNSRQSLAKDRNFGNLTFWQYEKTSVCWPAHKGSRVRMLNWATLNT